MNELTFLGSAGLGMLLVLVGLFMGGGDAHVEGADSFETDGSGGDVGEGMSLLSLTGIGAVLVGFGLGGYGGSAMGLNPWASVPLGLAAAYGSFQATAWLKRLLVRSLETGTSAGEQDMLYQPATVTVAVPPGGQRRGQVVVRKGDRTFYLTARTLGETELAEGQTVVITEGREGVFTVEPYQARV